MKDAPSQNEVFYSIIVPIYNVEQYLNQCIKSVLDQTCDDYELILVDDGSPDKCGNMIDDYAAKNNKIRVIHKKNGGLSSARNAGTEIAKGQYVIYLDSDDFWDDISALSNIKKNLIETNADLLVFPAKRYYGKEKESTLIMKTDVDRYKINASSKDEAVRYMITNNIYRAAAWNKVIRRKVIIEHNMTFKEGLLSEDMDWCGDMLLYCERFDFYNSPFYCYRQQRKGSITAGKTEKLVKDKLYMCEKGLKQAKHISGEMHLLLASYYAYEYSVAVGVSSGIRNKDILAQMKKLQELLKYDVSEKVKKVNRIKKILGYNFTRITLCAFVKLKR